MRPGSPPANAPEVATEAAVAPWQTLPGTPQVARRTLRTGVAIALSASVLALAIAGPASADTVAIVGGSTGQASTATTVCEFNAQTNTLTFTITNTSAITQPGSTSTITGIGFDLPPAGNASPSGLNGFTGMQAPSLSSTFTFSDAALGAVPGFAAVVLDFGFLTGSSGTFATGVDADGLVPGESASFTVSGAGFSGFTEAQICAAIFLRFQNVPTAGSDVGVPATAVVASLTLRKATDPASDPQVFDFDLTGPGVPSDADLDTDAGSASLPSEETYSLSASQLGAHTIVESAIPGWTLTGLVCEGAGADSSVDLATRTATLDIDGGETIVCTFTNTEDGLASQAPSPAPSQSAAPPSDAPPSDPPSSDPPSSDPPSSDPPSSDAPPSDAPAPTTPPTSTDGRSGPLSATYAWLASVLAIAGAAMLLRGRPRRSNR